MVKTVFENDRWNWNNLQNHLANQAKIMITDLGLNLKNEEQDWPI